MGKIFFAWECGAGMGHLTRMLPIARRLHDQGHDICLAVPSKSAAKRVLDRFFPPGDDAWRLDVVEGVAWKPPDTTVPPAYRIGSLADVFARFDGAHRGLLAEKVDAWRGLLEQHRPDLIVGDFAPSLRLAHTGNEPFLMLGNGYTTPPAGRPLPPIRPWQSSLDETSMNHEAELLHSFNDVRRQLGGRMVEHFSDMFNGEDSYICTVPEFDPYRAFRESPTFAPFNLPAVSDFQHLSQRRGNPIFVYFSGPHPRLKIVLRAITRMGIPCHAYIAHMPAEAVAKLTGRNVIIHRKPVDFERLLHRFQLIIHHAGLATAYAALRAGTPQFVMPVRLEHLVTARALEQFGTAVVHPAKQHVEEEGIISSIEHLLQQAQVADAAHETARNLQCRNGSESLEQIVCGCVKWMQESERRTAA